MAETLRCDRFAVADRTGKILNYNLDTPRRAAEAGAEYRKQTGDRGRKMRMKFKKTSQLLLVSAASLGVAGLLTACSQLTETLTIDFVYVTSAKAAGPDNYGEVDVFEINSQSGHMRQIPSSPFPSGGRNPVAEAVSSDNTNLYVVNQDDNTIVQFIIGSDGKLYPQNTVNTPGVFPLAVSVAKTTLFVAEPYQPLPTCSPASPCSGSIAVFPILPAEGSVQAGKLQTADGHQFMQRPPVCSPGGSGGSEPRHHADCRSASADGANLFVGAVDTTANSGYVFAYSVGSIDCGSTARQSHVDADCRVPLSGRDSSLGHHDGPCRDQSFT